MMIAWRTMSMKPMGVRTGCSDSLLVSSDSGYVTGEVLLMGGDIMDRLDGASFQSFDRNVYMNQVM
jgi:hypothetical protein